MLPTDLRCVEDCGFPGHDAVWFGLLGAIRSACGAGTAGTNKPCFGLCASGGRTALFLFNNATNSLPVTLLFRERFLAALPWAVLVSWATAVSTSGADVRCCPPLHHQSVDAMGVE